MDSVSLPIVASDTKLVAAWQIMRQSQRGAVLVRRSSDFELVLAVAISGSLAQEPRPTVGELKGTPVHAPAIGTLAAAKVDLTTPQQSGQAYERILANAGGSAYGILAASATTAIVITASERLADALSVGPRSCYCTNCGTGYDNATTGAMCNVCGKDQIYCPL